jgi:hypothetical protein
MTTHRTSTRRVKRSLLLVPVMAFAVGAVTASAQAADGGRPYDIVLTGEAERPNPGDLDGVGTAHVTVNPGQREVCYEVTVSDVSPITAAHIHRAPSTAAGPVVVPLRTRFGADGSSAGCESVDRALAVDLIRNPQNYYLNLHNADFPAGALRAQLG